MTQWRTLIKLNTPDEYGLKAGGILSALEKFSLKLGYLYFGCAENTSTVLQAKDTSVQGAVSPVKITQSFYKRQRHNDSFVKFFESTVTDARALNIENRYYQGLEGLQNDSERHPTRIV